MAFKMKGSPLHYGTSSHKSALKHNSDELAREKKNNGADWNHDESNHDHKDGEIYDPKVTTTNKDGSTKSTQDVRKTGLDSTECEKGFHKNKDGKCIKDESTGESDFDFKKTCYEKDGVTRVRNNPKCKWADETEGKEVDKSTDDSKRVITSETPAEKEKGCVKPPKPEGGSRSTTHNWVWNEEKCKWKQEYEKEKKCRDADKKEKACIGAKRHWSAVTCKCVRRRGGGGTGKKTDGPVRKAFRGLKRLFSRACKTCDCDAYADAGSEAKMPEGHTAC
jgi:hypothetical protein